MTSLIDTPVDVGNPDRVVQELLEAGKQGRPNQGSDRGRTQDTTDPRFRGKSAEDIIQMYQNLERHTGGLANEVGQLRRTTDAILLNKREADLRGNGGEPVTVKPTDLLENPTEALDEFLTSRLTTAIQPLRDRINGLETELASTRLAGTHSDANEVANSQEFKDWVQETPMRRQVANMAAQGHIRATQDLLTEFKSTKAGGGSGKTREQALADAERVNLEQSRTGNDGTTGGSKKTYRRSDLIALRQRDPDKYEDPVLQREIVAAYREGRVI